MISSISPDRTYGPDVGIVLMSVRLFGGRAVLIVSLGCAILTVAGYLLSPGDLLGTTAIANRLVSLSAIGATTFLAFLHRSAQMALCEMSTQMARIHRVTMVGKLTASITHEIKQPLAAMNTNAEAGLCWLAAQPPDLQEVRRNFEQILQNRRRASQVIDRICAQVRRAPMRSDWLNINDVILEVTQLTRSEMQRNGISLEMQLANDLPRLRGDPIQLQQVLLNLIVNAIESMREASEGRRELALTSAKDASNGVLVTVRDSGKGLAPNIFDHLFEAFYTNKPDGMGMGLTISRSIIKNHDGRLWAAANVPRGATFQIWLPAGSQRGRPVPPLSRRMIVLKNALNNCRVKSSRAVYAKSIACGPLVTTFYPCAIAGMRHLREGNQQPSMEITKMLTKTKGALVAVLILAPASVALANDTATDERGGGPAWTAQDLARSAQYIQDQIKKEYGPAQSSYGLVKPAKTRHPAQN
jgi:signal transduction histidine kinase